MWLECVSVSRTRDILDLLTVGRTQSYYDENRNLEKEENYTKDKFINVQCHK